MVRVPETDYDFQVRGIEIEGGNDPGVDVQYPWEDIPRRYHRHRVHVASFYVDRTPVTNAEFKKFLDATSYHPKDDHNFLRDWKNGSLPRRLGEKTGDLGLDRGCARLCQMGGQASAPRMGMAVGRAISRWPDLSLGK